MVYGNDYYPVYKPKRGHIIDFISLSKSYIEYKNTVLEVVSGSS